MTKNTLTSKGRRNNYLSSSNNRAGYNLSHTSMQKKMKNMLSVHVNEKYNNGGDFDSPK